MPSLAEKSRVGVFFALLACAALWVGPGEGRAAEKRFKNALGMEFVLIDAGTFLMGSPPEEPRRNKNETRHLVTITKPFYMQATEVTQEEWIALMGRKLFGRREEGRLPVAKVSWYDCLNFIEKLNGRKEGRYRLPTEAEWEYACRAGSQAAYPWGDQIDCSDAMYANNTFRADHCVDYVKAHGLAVDSPAPERSYRPNPWGLFNLPGNVWEWCSDWYGPYPDHPVTDPSGPPTGTVKVRRGGSWFGEGWLCRCANRNFGHPADRYRTLGFRLVREVD